jgi:hypothetical protein
MQLICKAATTPTVQQIKHGLFFFYVNKLNGAVFHSKEGYISRTASTLLDQKTKEYLCAIDEGRKHDGNYTYGIPSNALG